MDKRKRTIELSDKAATPQAGDGMEDGTIYAGTSPDTGEPMYTTPADAPMKMKWREAMDYAAALTAHGHKDWRLPSEAELNVLFNNRASIGGFDDDWYWSSSEFLSIGAGVQQFSDGSQGDGDKVNLNLVRCVRP